MTEPLTFETQTISISIDRPWQPDMSDVGFARGAAWMERDLAALKRMLVP